MESAMLRFDMKAGVVLSKKEFLKRLTPAEYAGIKAAAASNSTVDFYWRLFMTSGKYRTDSSRHGLLGESARGRRAAYC